MKVSNHRVEHQLSPCLAAFRYGPSQRKNSASVRRPLRQRSRAVQKDDVQAEDMVQVGQTHSMQFSGRSAHAGSEGMLCFAAACCVCLIWPSPAHASFDQALVNIFRGWHRTGWWSLASLPHH